MKIAKIDEFVDQFIENYERDHFLTALQQIISSPSVRYHAITSQKESSFLFALINFADASVFKGDLEFYQTLVVLLGHLSRNPLLRTLHEPFHAQLKKMDALFSLLQMHETDFANQAYLSKEIKTFLSHLIKKEFEQAKQLLPFLPYFYQLFFEKKLNVERGWQLFATIKPSLAQWFLEMAQGKKQPWSPFAYAISLKWRDLNRQGEIPLVFLEPIEGVNYQEILSSYLNQKAIFVIETFAYFYHLLQFEAFQQLLKEPTFILYILEFYPQTQFELQNYHWKTPHTFRTCFMCTKSEIEKRLTLFQEALSQCLHTSQASKETLEANWLYALAQEMIHEREVERYGPDRSLALSVGKGLEKWHDKYKGPLPSHASLGPPIPDELEVLIKQASEKRQKRNYHPKNRIRLVHVIPQIVDGGHAPTKLLKVLCELADKEWFDLFVYSTERLADRPLEYPSVIYSPPPSTVRGQYTIKFLESINVKIFIDPQSSTYEKAVEICQQALDQLETDIVIFHGPDEINSLCSASIQAPIRVLFDHGTLPRYPCFDLAILSTEEAYQAHQESYHQQGMESCFLPFSVDVRQEWQPTPYSRELLHLPEDAFVMTTISNHLENRVSGPMCEAIIAILQQCPQAVYAPIGRIENPEQFLHIFKQHQVDKQIILMSARYCPSQVARSMNLYLNEFPFGSGLGIFDAMAAGCPVVSMYHKEGPQQSRYGGLYFGLDYVIQSGRSEDYVDLACQLVNNPQLYQKWVQYALNRYEQLVNTKQYVKNFEKILDRFINHKT